MIQNKGGNGSNGGGELLGGEEVDTVERRTKLHSTSELLNSQRSFDEAKG